MRLTRDRWYSADGQRNLGRRAAAETKGSRKVISLVFLLVLIVLCMQQLSNPKKYEPAFKAIGLTPNSETAKAADPKLANSSWLELDETTEASSDHEAKRINLASVWSALLADANEDLLRALAVNCFVPPEDRSPEVNAADAAQLTELFLRVDQSLQNWKSEREQLPTPQDSRFDVFQEEWSQFRQSNLADLPPNSLLRESLSLAIDRRLIEQFIDASGWRKSETLAFARSIQRGLRAGQVLGNARNALMLAGPSIPAVDVPLLTKQSDALRGRLVRLNGSVALAEPTLVTRRTALGEHCYHVVWIRPDQVSTTPVCLYVPCNANAPNPFAQAKDQVFEFTAFPIKRLAYRAVEDMQIAPTLVALGYYPFVEPSQTTSATNDPANSTAASQLINDLKTLDPCLFVRRDQLHWLSPTAQLATKQAIDLLVAASLEPLLQSDAKSKLTQTIATLEPEMIRQITQLLVGIGRAKTTVLADRETSNPISITDLATFSDAEILVFGYDSVKLPKTLQESTNIEAIYQLRFAPLPANSDPVWPSEPTHILYVTDIPNPWKSTQKILQPVTVHGVQTSSQLDSTPVPWFADRIEWKLPNDLTAEQVAELSPSIDPELLPIAAGMFDLGMIDQVRKLQKSRLQPQERPAFFGLIAAVHDEQESPATSSATIVDCLQKPEDFMAKNLQGEARVVRVTRVALETETSKQLLGSDHYFEINVLCNIGQRAIRLVANSGEEPITFEGEFPTTIITRELPSFLLANSPIATTDSSTSESWYISKPITFTGRFYRLWSYQSQQTEEQKTSNVRQIAPLVIAKSIAFVPAKPDYLSKRIVGYTFTGLAILLASAFTIARVVNLFGSRQKKNARSK